MMASVTDSKKASRHLPRGMVILHEDRDLIVVEKPAGLLTIATDREKERTAYAALMSYVRKGQAKSRNRIFIVHRIDRETSGVLVFARSEEAKRRLQERWEETEKHYAAVVHGRMQRKSGVLDAYLMENRIGRIYSTGDAKRGQFSRTLYRVLEEKGEFSLLDLELITGRKHQIRVHLAEAGHPIIGDRFYGRKDGSMRMALHAVSLRLKHPWNGEWMIFESPMPLWFKKWAAS